MSLIKWEPFDEFDRLFRDVSALPALTRSQMNFDLACDVYEDGDTIVAEMNIPGLKPEDIDIEVEDKYVKIGGRREEVDEKKEKNHYVKEIRRGTFERLIALPSLVKENEVEAEYEGGVLKVKLPKRTQSEDKKVKIKVK